MDEAFGYVGLNWQDYVEIDPRYFRPTEVDYLLADPGRAQAALDWRPRIHFPDLVRIMVDADMEQLGLESPGEGRRILAERHGAWHQWISFLADNIQVI